MEKAAAVSRGGFPFSEGSSEKQKRPPLLAAALAERRTCFAKRHRVEEKTLLAGLAATYSSEP